MICIMKSWRRIVEKSVNHLEMQVFEDRLSSKGQVKIWTSLHKKN